VSENSVVRRIFGSKAEGVNENFRKTHKYEFRDLSCSLIFERPEICKEYGIWECGKNKGTKDVYTILRRKPIRN
jgi:hypothetical protein